MANEQSKHTPGPWRVEQFGGQDKWAVGPTIDDRVCDVWGVQNARLIAAAPDLLAALQEAIEYIPARARPVLLKQASEAIAAATA